MDDLPVPARVDPARPPAQTRIVVAMSGGVDSAVVAALYVQAGYDVVGVTMQLYDHGLTVGKAGTCCAGQDIYDAKQVADRLGIPHYVLDYESRFGQAVIEGFADAYAAGQTPIPCVICNQTVKFEDLLGFARELGAAALATGHYIRREDGPAGPELHAGRDPRRDQSYFLFGTTRDQLAYCRFPLGDLPKDRTRAIAAALGLPVAAKPDSQDICFVPDGDYAALVARMRPHAAEPGEIVDLSGQVLGRHEGTIHYTVGQRRGLGIGGGAPLYVIRVEPTRRRVVVGPRAALGVDLVRLRAVNWLGAGPAVDLPVQVKLRSTQPPVPGRFSLTQEGGGVIHLDSPLAGVAPGQGGVIYSGSRLLGGGWIDSAEMMADDAHRPETMAC